MEIKLKGLTAEQTAELVPVDRMALLGYRGSIAHGMFVPSNDPNSFDDKDVMGVFVGVPEHYLGFGRKETVEKFIGEWDAVSYELRKFVGLLTKQNPNVLSLLWLPENYYIYQNEVGRELVANRKLFASKAAYHSFVGYAHGQLKRMTHLSQEALAEINARAEVLRGAGAVIDENTGEAKLPAGASKDLQEAARQYGALRSKYFSGYMGNKRKGLVEKFGYDTKNAAHLIRILRMGIEFISEGILHVERADKLELLAIKRGAWTLEKVQAEAEKLFDLAREASVRSPLPAEVDEAQAEALLVRLLRKQLELTQS